MIHRPRRGPHDPPEGALTQRLGDQVAVLSRRVIEYTGQTGLRPAGVPEREVIERLTVVLAEAREMVGDVPRDRAWTELVSGGLRLLPLSAAEYVYTATIPGRSPDSLAVGDRFTVQNLVRAHTDEASVPDGDVLYVITDPDARSVGALVGNGSDLVMFGSGTTFVVTGRLPARGGVQTIIHLSHPVSRHGSPQPADAETGPGSQGSPRGGGSPSRGGPSAGGPPALPLARFDAEPGLHAPSGAQATQASAPQASAPQAEAAQAGPPQGPAHRNASAVGFGVLSGAPPDRTPRMSDTDFGFEAARYPRLDPHLPREEGEIAPSEGSVPSEPLAAARSRMARLARAGQHPLEFLPVPVTGGMLGARPGQGPGFGVEIEFELPGLRNQWDGMSHQERSAALRPIADALVAAGLSQGTTVYGEHASRHFPGSTPERDGWRIELDPTTHAELVSPILFDDPQAWADLATAVQVLTGLGARATVRTALHVNVGVPGLGGQSDGPARLLTLLRAGTAFEDVLFRLATSPYTGQHRGTAHASPLSRAHRDLPGSAGLAPGLTLAGLTTALGHVGRRRPMINVGHVTGSDQDRGEFRLFDGTLDATVIQRQVLLAAALTHYATHVSPGRAEQELAAAGPQPLGHHLGTGVPQPATLLATPDGLQIGGDEQPRSAADFSRMIQLITPGPQHHRSRAALAELFTLTRWQDDRARAPRTPPAESGEQGQVAGDHPATSRPQLALARQAATAAPARQRAVPASTDLPPRGGGSPPSGGPSAGGPPALPLARFDAEPGLRAPSGARAPQDGPPQAAARVYPSGPGFRVLPGGTPRMPDTDFEFWAARRGGHPGGRGPAITVIEAPRTDDSGGAVPR